MPFFLLAQAADAVDPIRSFLGGPNSTFFLIAIFFAIFYLMIIRPQQKTQDKLKSYLSGLKKGDEIVTTGGLIGRIFSVAGDVLMLEVASNVKVRVLKAQVTGPYVQAEEKPAEAEKPAAKADEAKK